MPATVGSKRRVAAQPTGLGAGDDVDDLISDPDATPAPVTTTLAALGANNTSASSAFRDMYVPAPGFDDGGWTPVKVGTATPNLVAQAGPPVRVDTVLHAVKMLPASREVSLISTDDRNTKVFGWIVTLIPRVGIVRPF